jgi:hypothetical protein
MVVSCFSVVTLLPGLGFGGLLVVAGISIYSTGKPSQSRANKTEPHELGRTEPGLTHDELVDVVAGLAGRQGRERCYSQFEVLVTSVTYGDFEILVTHTPENGYCAAIRDRSRRPYTTLDNYATTDHALRGAREYIDALMEQYVGSDRQLT